MFQGSRAAERRQVGAATTRAKKAGLVQPYDDGSNAP